MSTEPCGPPEAHFSEWSADELDAAIEPIEIVDSIELEGAIEEGIAAEEPSPSVEVLAEAVAAIVQAYVEPSPAIVEPTPSADVTTEIDAVVEPIVEPVAEPIVEAAAPSEPALSIEIEASVEAEPMAAAADDGDSDEDDPYAVFIRTLAEVAVASGATMDAATIDALLESDAVATAWRAILRGESEDFSQCAATLDEWAANALASILSAPQKAAQLRRELRARGVAAFGLIDAA